MAIGIAPLVILAGHMGSLDGLLKYWGLVKIAALVVRIVLTLSLVLVVIWLPLVVILVVCMLVCYSHM